VRRKKPRVVWLPSDITNRLGKAPLAATSDLDSQTIIKIFTANPLGATPVTEEIPIVKDFASTAGGGFRVAQETTLADIISTGYRLRRIVGKISFAIAQKNANDDIDPSTWHITAGFIVRRIDPNLGTSLASVGAAGLDISTVTFEAVTDPWIWRRSWNLADQQATLADGSPVPQSKVYPPSNDLYGGGNLDGPHVDAKTARVIAEDERLFLSVTVEGLDGTAQGAPGAVIMIADLRVLASLRQQQGNRRNASR